MVISEWPKQVLDHAPGIAVEQPVVASFLRGQAQPLVHDVVQDHEHVEGERANECRAECGVANGGSLITPPRTSRQRRLAPRKTFSQEAGLKGRPASVSQTHIGSGPAARR